MTVAALEALALLRCLRRGTDGLARRCFRATAKVVGVAWRLATGADLSLPEVEGARPLPVRIANKYVDGILAAAESDTVVAEQFAKVIGFLDPPTRLLHPVFIARVATINLRRRQCDHATTQAQLSRCSDDWQAALGWLATVSTRLVPVEEAARPPAPKSCWPLRGRRCGRADVAG
jgi:hypothetical protein